MAVENDYDLLVFNLNELAKEITLIRDQVQERLPEEAREGSSETPRVGEFHGCRLPIVSGLVFQLEDGARRVLGSRPGEAVFIAQPPAPPETLP
jgi:hypothetical protein